jgi:tetratricopeptide (TPR) repeat protein
MNLELRSPLRTFSFAAVCLLCIGFYVRLAVRTYLASRLAAVPESGNLRRAIGMEPSNAEYRELLGRNLALSIGSLDDGISNLQIAAQLNPYVATYWLDLAGAYQIAGRIQEQGDSVEHAVTADPTTPHVAWEAANFFLVQGDREQALRNFRVVLAEDPDTVDSALQLCWRATGDENVMLAQALPPRQDLYLSFLRLLMQKQQPAAAENVWNHLIALKQTFSVRLAFPYFRFLLAQQEVAAAQAAWQQLADLNPSLERYLPSSHNLIVNGGFEENLLNGGFDWWYEAPPNASLAIDTSEFHSGTRSVSVTFDGHNAPDAGIAQFVPVKPNTEYEFSGAFRSEDLDTASGPRFAVVDAYSNVSYVLTDDARGSNPWQLQQAQFRTGPDTTLVLLRIIQQPPALIRGKLWIDDLKLVEK